MVFQDRNDISGGTAEEGLEVAWLEMTTPWRWPGDLTLKEVKEHLVADRQSILDRTRQGEGVEIKLPTPRARKASPWERKE